MIANYGYKDGSGEYYISIDTDKCIDCSAARACLTACPKQMFEPMTDDYDDDVVAIKGLGQPDADPVLCLAGPQVGSGLSPLN